MKRHALLFLAVVLMATARTLAADSGKPTLFVAPLDGDLSQIQGWQPALGEGLAEMLITELGKLGKFDVLESTALPELMKEINLGEQGYVADGEKVDKGGFAGADFMFRGKVTRFGYKKQGIDLSGFVPGSLGKLGVKQTTADVRIDWRLVDAYSRKVIKTGDAVGKEVGTGFDVGVGVGGHGGGIGFQNQEFMNSALGKATVKTLTNIMAQVMAFDVPESGRRQSKAGKEARAGAEMKAAADAVHGAPGKVLAVPAKGVVIVSLGAKQGFKTGDKLLLYETLDTKDEKGEVVFSEEKLVGEVTLQSVQDERSKAAAPDGITAKPGWVVKAK